jgi:hypothetical protein
METLAPEKFSLSFLNLFEMVLKSKNELGSLKISRYFLFYRFGTNQRSLRDSKNNFENKTQNQRNHLYFGSQKIPCCLFPEPINQGIFSLFGRFIEEYLSNLTCWKKFGLGALKLSKNR